MRRQVRRSLRDNEQRFPNTDKWHHGAKGNRLSTDAVKTAYRFISSADGPINTMGILSCDTQMSKLFTKELTAPCYQEASSKSLMQLLSFRAWLHHFPEQTYSQLRVGRGKARPLNNGDASEIVQNF
ncbi:hypothetical protein M404DRAFT_725667 [Pisolithus tinctorius Marx 270]|uniref:Uncharacterized protein n=1 Tax=Pisolithus tinctorius Marx 270 TaxID=870435 RepID=A0A0C3NLG0_PISTI|nr:hypothetical protein M404DRAFT_725667 [Pisolithus tinctorius Marx 270]